MKTEPQDPIERWLSSRLEGDEFEAIKALAQRRALSLSDYLPALLKKLDIPKQFDWSGKEVPPGPRVHDEQDAPPDLT